jgi:hypothetical protein
MTHQIPIATERSKRNVEIEKAHFCHDMGVNFSFSKRVIWKPKAPTDKPRIKLTAYVSCDIVVDCHRIKLPLGSSLFIVTFTSKVIDYKQVGL